MQLQLWSRNQGMRLAQRGCARARKIGKSPGIRNGQCAHVEHSSPVYTCAQSETAVQACNGTCACVGGGIRG